MRCARPLLLAVVVLTGACGSNSKSSSPTAAPGPAGSTTTTAGSGTGDTTGHAAVAVTKACTVLGPADFKAVGFTVDSEGEDVSQNFNLSTTTSVACQWTNFDNNQGGSWELVIGTGDAKAAFAGDLLLAKIDTVTKLSIGDESYLADKVTSSDKTDHDFEAGVRIGDTYFTMSSTDDKGADAVTALAKLVVDRITKA
jgi:hypothetical protein